MKENLTKPDFILLGAAASILILGILILSSTSAFLAQSRYHDSYYLLKHQILLGVIPGLMLGFIMFRLPTEFIRKASPYLMFLVIIALVIVFIPGLALQAGGAQRWIHFGSFTVQPSEILKLIFIIYLASWLAAHLHPNVLATKRKKTKKNNENENEFLLPFLAVLGIVGLLIVSQPDLSTFVIIAAIAVTMYFAAGGPIKHLLFIFLVGGIVLLALIYTEPYRFTRFSSWLNPQQDPLGSGFQANQALIIIGSGGVYGQGFGSTSSKYALLPELIGDSVFAPFAAETGFIGGTALIILFCVLIWRLFLIASRIPTRFEKYSAIGIAAWFAVQSFLNIASTMRLLPLSGVPLPLVSYGGTALTIELAAIGFALNLSRRQK